VETQAVVDAPDPLLRVDDEMAALAVAVVEEEIERRYLSELGWWRGSFNSVK